MSRTLKMAGHLALGVAVLGLGACSLDPVGSSTPPRADAGAVDPGNLPTRIPNAMDPEYDPNLDALGIVCQTTMTLTGTFQEGEPQPADLNGCWPVGTWTVQTQLDFVGCDPQEPIAQEFVYTVQRIDDSNVVIFDADPDNERVNFKISTDSSGGCFGGFEHYGLDLRVINLQPDLLPGTTTLTGEGFFQVWLEDPF